MMYFSFALSYQAQYQRGKKMNQERIMGNSSTYGEADQHVEHFRKEEKEMVYTIDYYKQNAEELKEMLHQSRMENKRLRLLFGQGDQYDDCPGEHGAFDQKERWCQKFVLKSKHNVEEQNTTSDERRKLCEAYSELMAEFRNLQMLTKKQSEVIQNLTCHKQQNICPESIPIQCTDLEASEALQVTSYTRFPSHGFLLLQGAKTELSATQAWAEKQVKIEEQPIIHVPQADLKPPPPFQAIAPETTSSVAISPSRTACENRTMYTGIRHTEPSQHDEDISGDNENFLRTVDTLSILGLKRPPPDSDYLNPFINSTTHEHLCEEIRGFPLKPKALCETMASCVASNKKSSSSTIEKRVMPKGIAKHQGTDTDHDIPARFPQIGKERKDVKVPSTEDIGNICLTPRSIGTDEFAFIARTCPICTIVIYVRPGNEDEMQHHVNTHLDNDLGQ